jgi:hypothetical protein
VAAAKTKELNVSANWWTSFPTSPPLDVEAGLRYKTREHRMKDPVFLGACALAEIEATPRQARKWANGQGVALRFRNEAKSLL